MLKIGDVVTVNRKEFEGLKFEVQIANQFSKALYVTAINAEEGRALGYGSRIDDPKVLFVNGPRIYKLSENVGH